MTVVNAENKVLGRLASEIAKKVEPDREVKVVNAEKAVISGSEEEVKDEYRQKYERGSRDFGPYYPKRPDKILKRTVRNMLPDTEEGEEEFRNVKTYLGVPEQFDEVEDIEAKEGDELKNRNYVKLGEVSKHIGWNPRGEA